MDRDSYERDLNAYAIRFRQLSNIEPVYNMKINKQLEHIKKIHKEKSGDV